MLATDGRRKAAAPTLPGNGFPIVNSFADQPRTVNIAYDLEYTPCQDVWEGFRVDYLIGAFSKITGLSIDTLRYYEKERLIFRSSCYKARFWLHSWATMVLSKYDFCYIWPLLFGRAPLQDGACGNSVSDLNLT